MKRALPLLLLLAVAGCSSREDYRGQGVPPAFGAAYIKVLAPAGCSDFRRRGAKSAGDEIRRLDALLAEADRKGLGPGRRALGRAWEDVDVTADTACAPDRINSELKLANDRLERALKDIE